MAPSNPHRRPVEVAHRTGPRLARQPGHQVLNKADVESCRMCDANLGAGEQTLEPVQIDRLAANSLIGDPGEPGDVRRDRHARIAQRLPGAGDADDLAGLVHLDHDHRDVDDLVVDDVGAGRLGVDDGNTPDGPGDPLRQREVTEGGHALQDADIRILGAGTQRCLDRNGVGDVGHGRYLLLESTEPQRSFSPLLSRSQETPKGGSSTPVTSEGIDGGEHTSDGSRVLQAVGRKSPIHVHAVPTLVRQSRPASRRPSRLVPLRRVESATFRRCRQHVRACVQQSLLKRTLNLDIRNDALTGATT